MEHNRTSTTLQFKKLNESYFKVHATQGMLQELSDSFTFNVPGARFSPAFRRGMWDGKIRMINLRNNTMYAGLSDKLKEYGKHRQYNIEFLDDNSDAEFSVIEAEEFIKSLDLPDDIKVRDYQLEAFTHAVRKGRLVLLSPTNCHKRGDKVFTKEGWKPIESIKVSNKIFGADGKEKEVLKVFKGKDNLYEIIPKKGLSKITVTGNHILTLKHTDINSRYGYSKRDKDRITKITVEDYLKKSNTFKHCSVLFYNDIPLEYGNPPKTLLSPYFIGLYLGDGHTHTCAVTTKDEEIIQCIENESQKFGCTIRKSGISYFIKGAKNKRNIILSEFDKLGLHFINNGIRTKCEDKFIPKTLLESNLETRKELLAGLIDSDGHKDSKSKTIFSFSSKSKYLAQGVHQLAISLGLIAYIKEKYNKRYNKTYYNVIINGNTHIIPTRVKRKQNTVLESEDLKRRRYISKFIVKPLDEQEFFGFEVEDNLYITNDGMITHNSGKSLIMYLLLRYYDTKTLIVVPSTALCLQLQAEFEETYGFQKNNIQLIYEGQSKEIDKQVTISTWQSIYKMPEDWLNQFNMITVDEVHTAKAECLRGIMEKSTRIKFRIGLTGTIQDTKTDKLVIEGLFGPIVTVTTNRELIDKGHSADISIKTILLKYPDEIKRLMKRATYDQEIDFIRQHNKRNNFLANLALSLEGNVLILFRYIDQGESIHDILSLKASDRNLYFVTGENTGKEKNKTRIDFDKEKNAILLASDVFTTGINIKNINYIIFATPTKARIKILQSIGRGFRRTPWKTKLTLFDVADDISWKNRRNYTLTHFLERIRIYDSEKFPYKIYNVKLGEKPKDGSK